jgi:hypothetical protein
MIRIPIRITLQELIELYFLNLLLPDPCMQVTEHLDVPRGQSQLLHKLIRHDQFLVHGASHMKRPLARVEVALNTRALRHLAYVAFELKSVVVELAPENTQSKKNYMMGGLTWGHLARTRYRCAS